MSPKFRITDTLSLSTGLSFTKKETVIFFSLYQVRNDMETRIFCEQRICEREFGFRCLKTLFHFYFPTNLLNI